MIHVLDLQFKDKPDTIASFLIETGAGPVLIETGPYSTFGHLEKAVKAKGYALEDIHHVFITHIHLDHAGAAWAMAERGATIYLHPFGEAHMHDPSKLLASATRIYGDEMDSLWGTLKPIPKAKLKTVDHGEVIFIGGISLKAYHTPGHAVHHIAWQAGNTLFTGDVAGVKIEGGPVMPPCPPPDINIEDWQESLRLIRSLELDELYLTHFGPIPKAQINQHLDELEAGLLDWTNWMRPHYEKGEKAEAITPVFQAYVQRQLLNKGVAEEQLELYENANPSWMSVAGLLRYWRKKLEA
ncbi:MAG: MBL fold metallo-hydrolase [Phaeodactylibacter sp.]|nr:MBL fold metallo-hydrolase [Phaeodactylibacter sp.]MCB9303470.1 MBL fold metallo-hydrolase [Lewinellaceae bacterium]